jgi:type IV pilus assembly protein PilQ
MRKFICIAFAIFSLQLALAQEYDPTRVAQIEAQLSSLEADIPGLTEKINIDLQQAKLSTFLLAISEVHKINIDVHPELGNTEIINNFKNVEVIDVLIYLCKNQNLRIDQTGTILSIRHFVPEPEVPDVRVIPITYNPTKGTLFADLKNDVLSEVSKLISDKSGKGVFFEQGMGDSKISVFIKDLPLELAMEKLAFSNNLLVTITKDGSFEFEKAQTSGQAGGISHGSSRPKRSRRSNFYFKVLDTVSKRLDIAFENVPVSDVVYDIGNALQLDIFTAAPLEDAGMATVNAKDISFDQLLTKIFESDTQNRTTQDTEERSGNRNQNLDVRSSQTKQFTYKVEDEVYYFGTSNQLTLRSSEIVPLYYRSIQMLADPTSTGRTVGRTVSYNQGDGAFNRSGQNQNFNSSQNSNSNRYQNRNSQTPEKSPGTFLDLIPKDVTANLSVTEDVELNSFVVSGPSADVISFKAFIKKIDKPVPVVMIEVMILDISKSTSLEAGVEWGIGEGPTTTKGTLFPRSQISLGANTVNRILGRIDGANFLNIGSVVPNFYANIKAMETNGFLKIRSSPRITTLNGHRAYFSNGETSYYAVTNQTFNGVQNPITSQITNYEPIDAELSLDVRPFVSADGQITMEIKVIQSSFNGERIAVDAPPGLDSREFTSIVKANNNDIIVLGGLEERRTRNSGSGVPFLARIPIIKWLFSTRVREGSKSKLTVLIKPTVIY